MDGFTFRGVHVSAYGAVAALGDSMHIGAKIERSEYEMPDGSMVEIGEAAQLPTTRVLRLTPQDGEEATPQWRRRLLTWLQGGRGELIFDNDPDVVRIASFDTSGTYEWRSWPMGMVQLTMTLQPYARSRTRTRAAAVTSGGEAALELAMETALCAPITIEATAQGGTMTALEAVCGDQVLRIEGMSVPEGGTLVYCAGEPGIEDAAVIEQDGTLSFAHVTRWARLLARGETAVTVRVSGSEAAVTVSACCRWPE